MTHHARMPGADSHEPAALTVHAGGRCSGCPLRGAEMCRVICDHGAPRTCPPPLRHYRKGKLILERGKPSGFLGVIRRGYAWRSEMRINGKRILFGLAIPGDLTGALPGQIAACDLEAATDLEICAYEPGAVNRQLTQNPRLRQILLQEVDRQHHRFLESLWRYGTLNSRERIIAFLLMATELMPTEPLPDGSLILKMEIERRDWADLTNTAVETISRTLRYLEEKALLTSLSPYRFRLHDLDRLTLLAGVDPVRRQKPGHDRAGPPSSPCDGPISASPMTAVNAPILHAANLATSREPGSAATRGLRRGRLADEQEEHRH